MTLCPHDFAAPAVLQSDPMHQVLQLLQNHSLLFLAAVQFLFGRGLIIY